MTNEKLYTVTAINKEDGKRMVSMRCLTAREAISIMIFSEYLFEVNLDTTIYDWTSERIPEPPQRSIKDYKRFGLKKNSNKPDTMDWIRIITVTLVVIWLAVYYTIVGHI